MIYLCLSIGVVGEQGDNITRRKRNAPIALTFQLEAAYQPHIILTIPQVVAAELHWNRPTRGGEAMTRNCLD